MAEDLSLRPNTAPDGAPLPTQRREAARRLMEWAHVAVRRKNKVRKDSPFQLRQELEVSHARETAYRSMAQYVIGFAARDELGALHRTSRRQRLANMWRNMQQRLAFKANRGW